jgi:pyruvate dehydrogenase E1 component alpha subunit
VEYVQVLDEEGKTDQDLQHGLSEDQIKEIYHLMVLTRTFDERLFKLQRSGKIGTYAQVKGQEASEIASGFALEKEDWVIPSFRELGVLIARGADRVRIVQGWRGDNRAFHDPDHNPNLPTAIPIASQLLHATGIAWASKLRKEKRAAIVYFGDGATSEGDFHEALNFAADYKIPVIFFCQNNQWAISTPREKQTAAETIAQKAIGYGMKGVQVDGNDALAVYMVTREALERARNGEGPTLIESMTFRMGDHTTSDDSAKYRDPKMVEEWSKKDPVARIQKHFEQLGTWTEEYGQWVQSESDKEVNEAVEAGLTVEGPPPESMFDFIWDVIPDDLQAQKEQLLAELGQKTEKGDA